MYHGQQWLALIIHTFATVTLSWARVSTRSYTFSRNSDYDGMTTTHIFHLLSKLENVKSSFQCARLCLSDNICRGYFYNTKLKSCSTLYNLFASNTVGELTSEDDSLLFVMTDLTVAVMPPVNYIYNHEQKYSFKPYFLGADRRIWSNAKSFCEGRTREKLAILDTGDKNSALLEVLNGKIPYFAGMETYYVGGEQVSSVWRWINSASATITSWYSTEPDSSGTCLGLQSYGAHPNIYFKMADADCMITKGFICEFDVL